MIDILSLEWDRVEFLLKFDWLIPDIFHKINECYFFSAYNIGINRNAMGIGQIPSKKRSLSRLTPNLKILSVIFVAFMGHCSLRFCIVKIQQKKSGKEQRTALFLILKVLFFILQPFSSACPALSSPPEFSSSWQGHTS